ncbi:MAG: hypothetical protein DMG76_37930, partial [Acidobacteria bacterium]
ISMAVLRTIGRNAARLWRLDIHFYVARPLTGCTWCRGKWDAQALRLCPAGCFAKDTKIVGGGPPNRPRGEDPWVPHLGLTGLRHHE